LLAAPSSKHTTPAGKTNKRMLVYRASRIPECYEATLRKAMISALKLPEATNLQIKSFSTNYYHPSTTGRYRTATLECTDIVSYLTPQGTSATNSLGYTSSNKSEWQIELVHPSLGHVDKIFIDSHFMGFTPLSPLALEQKHSIE
jgi:hypothetical protein